jgi:hypothetical protein
MPPLPEMKILIAITGSQLGVVSGWLSSCSYTEDMLADIEAWDDSEDQWGVKPYMSCCHLRSDDLPASWLVSKYAQSGDLILLVIGSPLLLLVRPRPSLPTYEFVGQAMPCQMTWKDKFPSLVLHRLVKDIGQSLQSTEAFVLE